MILTKLSSTSSDYGFIYIASLKRYYYHLAVYSATSLKDYFPDAHITLFTHQDFIDSSVEIFDQVVTEIPIYYRTKMWAMARTPYKRTVYIDADSYIAHKDIRNVFKELDNCDMFFGPVQQYTTGDVAWAFMDRDMTISPSYHGALCGYNSTPLVIDFMQTWYDEYIKQICSPGWPFKEKHDKKWKVFDMFTLWRLSSKMFQEFERFSNLNIKLVNPRYTTTAQHSVYDKNNPIIVLVDTNTWKQIDKFKQIIEKSNQDAIYNTQKYPINVPPTQYN